MPVIASAEKKMRKDKKRTLLNKKRKEEVKKLISLAKKSKTPESVKKAQSAVAKLSKVNIIHKNKAARLISQLYKLGKTTAEKLSKKKEVSSIEKVKSQSVNVVPSAKPMVTHGKGKIKK